VKDAWSFKTNSRLFAFVGRWFRLYGIPDGHSPENKRRKMGEHTMVMISKYGRRIYLSGSHKPESLLAYALLNDEVYPPNIPYKTIF
jgi:hypothetical protein